MTATGTLLGTLRYMSPEQAQGNGLVDHRSDLYSLGMTLYEFITLRAAFPEENHTRLLHQIAADEPPSPRRINPSIPIDLETILLKAIGKRPEDRYATTAQFATDLTNFLEHKTLLARRPRWRDRVLKWGVRHPGVVGTALTGLFLAAVILTASVLWVGHVNQNLVAAYAVTEQRTKQAEVSRRQAEEAQELTAGLLYAADVRLAASAVEESNVQQASTLLARHIPQVARLAVPFFAFVFLPTDKRLRQLATRVTPRSGIFKRASCCIV